MASMKSSRVKTNILVATIMAMAMAGGVSFNRMKLNQEMNMNAMEAMNSSVASSNGTVVIGVGVSASNLPPEMTSQRGITFDIQEDGSLDIIFSENGLDLGTPMERIHVNGVSLRKIILDEINGMVELSPSSLTNMVLGMWNNPLWGKKLVAIGDSLISTPTRETSYPSFIAKRNNMTLVHQGMSGKRLCRDVGENIAMINCYTNIPSDADYILCQIGANDTDMWNGSVDDADMTTNTFKGCWNTLLIGMKKRYPTAKMGFIVANGWGENIGQKSEDATRQGTLRDMTQWQKIQCQKLNIPVFDPVEDTRMFTYNYKTYSTNDVVTPQVLPDSQLDWYDRTKREMGTDNIWYKPSIGGWVSQTTWLADTWHTTEKGNEYLSFFYEEWMKTILSLQ